MTHIVPEMDIKRIVGVDRHPTEHWGRAVSAEQTVYIFHSVTCFASGIDLRRCEFSEALDLGVDLQAWTGHEDRPVRLAIRHGYLEPAP